MDVALATAAFAGSLIVFGHGSSGAERRLDVLGVVLAACASMPLVVWRRAPLGVFVGTTLASATSMILGYPGGPPIGPTVALFLLATSRDERHPWTPRTTGAVVGLFALHFTAFGIGHGSMPSTELAVGALVWALAWFAGDRLRLRRVQIAALEQRATLAEEAAQRERRLAAAEERARIARDLHDSAGHAINVIAVHAGAARLLLDHDPAGSLAALETIEQVARQTGGEIDQIVRSLRADDGPNATSVETPPGLAALDPLVSQHAGAGLAVTVKRVGERRPLGGALDQAAYRILQEALTNAARHGSGEAEVQVAFGARALELTVTNSANGRAAGREDSGGHGLVGMRERAAMLGGELDAERVNGRFLLRARLPYRGA